MRKTLCAFVLVAAVSTSGCASLRGRSATPDEFAVARNAPLIIPPDFSLAPPVAGTAALTAGEAQQQAIDTLFGGPAPRSAGESSMLDAAGRDGAQVGIRSSGLGSRHTRRRQGSDDAPNPRRPAGEQQHRLGAGRTIEDRGERIKDG